MSAVRSLAAARSSLVAPDAVSALTERIPRRHMLKFLGALPFTPPAPPTAKPQPRSLAPIISRAPRVLPEVAVSIDDGWNPYWVTQALNILDAFNVKATLFPTGAVVREHPDLWQRAYTSGHELGNHTFTHRPLPQLADQEILAEIDQTQAAVQDATGANTPMQLLRPPGMLGFTTWGGNRRIRQVVAERQLRITLWDSASSAVVMPQREDPEAVLAEVARDARRGSIVLLHFIRDDIHALPLILTHLRRSYQLVTISQLLAHVYQDNADEPPNRGQGAEAKIAK